MVTTYSGKNKQWRPSTFNPQPRERVQPPVQTYLCVQCRAGDCWDRWSQRWRLLNWFAFHRFQDPPQTTHPAFYLRRLLTNSSDVGQSLLLWQSVSHMMIKNVKKKTKQKCANLTCIEYPIRAPAGSCLYQLRDGKRKFLQIYQYNKSNKFYFFFLNIRNITQTSILTIKPSWCFPPSTYKLPSLGSGRKPGLNEMCTNLEMNHYQKKENIYTTITQLPYRNGQYGITS